MYLKPFYLWCRYIQVFFGFRFYIVYISYWSNDPLGKKNPRIVTNQDSKLIIVNNKMMFANINGNQYNNN